MQILTYNAETQKAARDTILALEKAMLDDLQAQIDAEGCGAFMCAYFYQNEIESGEGQSDG